MLEDMVENALSEGRIRGIVKDCTSAIREGKDIAFEVRGRVNVNRVKQILEDKSLRMADLAKYMDISHATLWSYMNGYALRLRYTRVIDIADFLGVAVEEIYYVEVSVD